ncbi:PHP domain-containing protein [Desulfococcaceae bacterium HSG8]|nr:PHP domain-containing protein [Desulfococcaceae bacterium HSG8]
MLNFSRNKLVSIARKDEDTLLVHGILDDVIYGLEVDATVRISDMTFLSVNGKWNRYTTPECPKALPFLREATGFCINDKNITQKLQKTVGRKGCRHFATILIECCRSVKEAVRIIQWEAIKADHPNLTFEEFVNGEPREASYDSAEEKASPPHIEVREKTVRKDMPDARDSGGQDKTSGGFVIDLHTHTFPASPCSSVSEDDLITEAKRISLDGICLADHNYVWPVSRVEDLIQKHGFPVFRGNEVTTDQGHMLVFGLEKEIRSGGLVKIEELREAVEEADGFMIVAHPFRGFLTFGVGQLGLTVEKAMERPFFKYVDAIEVMNGKVTEKENGFASEVSAALGLPVTGGSDAHEVSEVGLYATRFPDSIKNENDLLNALKSGKGSPLAFRKEKTMV